MGVCVGVCCWCWCVLLVLVLVSVCVCVSVGVCVCGCSRDNRNWERRVERSLSGSTSRKRKSTHRSVLPVQMKSFCKRRWKICSKSLWRKTARRKPKRGRTWGRRIPTPKDAVHGRRYGMRESSLVAVSCSWKLSRDVRLDDELTALVSSVETTLCSGSCLSLHDQGHPANEADTFGDRSLEPVDCRDRFARVHPERVVVLSVKRLTRGAS